MLDLRIDLGRNQGIGSIKLHNFTKDFKPNLIRGFRRGGVILQGQIQRNVTGPSATIDKSRTMPGSVTGRLRGSIKYDVNTAGPVLRVGPNTVYAAIHEFGGHIVQTVTAKQQRFLAAAKGIFVKVASTLNIHIPKRPYVWPAWEKKRGQVVDEIQKSIGQPLK